MEGKVNLQLRFDSDDIRMQRALPILSLLPRTKSCIVALALDEFFSKYGIYNMEPDAAKKFLSLFLDNYELLRRIIPSLGSHEQVMPSLLTSESIPAPKQNIPVREKARKEGQSNNSIANGSLRTQAKTGVPDSRAEDSATSTPALLSNIQFNGDPQLSKSQKDNMRSKLKMFGI